jgi:hypothetical protein
MSLQSLVNALRRLGEPRLMVLSSDVKLLTRAHSEVDIIRPCERRDASSNLAGHIRLVIDDDYNQ